MMAQWSAMPRRGHRRLRSGTRGARLRRGAGPWLALGLAFALPAASTAEPSGAGPRLAYVDPGAGSFILQAVVATLAGAVVIANSYWRRIKRFLGFAGDERSEREDEAAAPRDDG
jgi:hypothetical protein